MCDPACGSGHMLTYAFDLLYEIYEEEGYAPSDIPGLILKHNLYGMEIDERAVSLAAFALTMKARSRSRRFFKKQVEPNIQRIAPISFEEGEVAELNDLYQVNLDSMVWNTYAKADVYGSLIQPPRELVDLASSAEDTEDEITLADSLLRECADEVFAQTRYLARKYMAVVANPPYMGAKNMSAELKQFVQDHYEDVKADLYGCFYVRFLKFAMEYGLEGMVLGDTWMFIKTFEEMRKDLIKKRRIESFLHIRDITNHPDIFGANAAFIICPCYVSHKKTTFIKLTQTGVVRKRFELLSILAADKSKARFEVNQHEFVQIPGSPIVYWLSEAVFKIFDRKIAKGVTTGDNARFLRFWWECYCRTIQFDRISLQETPLQRWVPCDKGGGFRRWSGNNEYIVDWTENGEKLFDFPGSTPRNREITFKNALACSKISSGQPSFRRRNHGFAYSDAAVALSDSTLLSELNCFLNSTTALTIMQALSPTLNFEVGQIRSLPCKFGISANWRDREKELVSASEKDWDSFETSWDFQRFALLDPDQGAQAGNLLEDAVLHLREYWHRVSEEQRQREIRNNEMVADAYGVRDDVPCDVPLERVSLKRNVAFAYPKDTPGVRNEKFAQDVVKELISYAVGCMFGRYSLDKPGLILASQGETLDDYHAQIPNPSFGPDADNVIPVTETDCFEDDIVTRFRRFLTVAFGKENLAANIAYIEQVLGKSIRKYFVNDFYNDHVKMYSNRPIYWQYSSQTSNKGSFKALVYLHRYTPKTTNVVLNYLRDYANKIADIADSLEHSDRAADQKQAAKLRKAVLECKDYEDQTLYPLATRNLEMDLDDGVLVNYLRMGKALRSIPAIEKKRKEVSTWTWPVHPLKD